MRKKGGDWPVTERSTLSPESAAIIFGAQPSEIIGPLVDSTGFTIVLVEKKGTGAAAPLSAIKEQIDIMARNKRSNERYKKMGGTPPEKKPSSKYTSDSSPFPIAGPAHSTRPVRRSLSFPLFFFPPTVPSALLLLPGGIFLSPISLEDAFIHNWTAAASHPA